MITQTTSKKTFQRLFQQQMKRAQSSSTMALCGNAPRNEKSSTLSLNKSQTSATNSEMKQDFSTAIETHNFDDLFLQQIVNSSASTSMLSPTMNNSNVKSSGVEVHPTEAAILAKTDNYFDKVVIFISHGETAVAEEGEMNINPSLTGKGMGHAMNISRETAIFCSKSTGLVPELYVVSPLRCTTESALLAFPYDAPGNIHNLPWICHSGCVDAELDGNNVENINDLESAFPGIDFEILKKGKEQSETHDFLSWLSEREEKVVVVSSTESWVNEFINTHAPVKTCGDDQLDSKRLLRTIGIKFN